MRFREYSYHHRGLDSEFSQASRLILSGGPGGVWANKPLDARTVQRDIEGFYAVGVHGVTEQHVQQIRDMVEAYESGDHPSLDELMDARDTVMEKPKSVREILSRPMVEMIAKDGRPVDLSKPPKPTGRPTSLIPAAFCDWSSTTNHGLFRKRCGKKAVYGLTRCDVHGGMDMDPSELRDYLRSAATKLVLSSNAAAEALIDLMTNSVDDTVRLRAAEAILDRVGMRANQDIHVHMESKGSVGAAQTATAEIRKRLMAIAGVDDPDPNSEHPRALHDPDEDDHQVIDAEIVPSL